MFETFVARHSTTAADLQTSLFTLSLVPSSIPWRCWLPRLYFLDAAPLHNVLVLILISPVNAFRDNSAGVKTPWAHFAAETMSFGSAERLFAR